jgi:hypothetical protein
MMTTQEILTAMAQGRLRLELHGLHTNVPVYSLHQLTESGQDSYRMLSSDEAKSVGLPIALGTHNQMPDLPDWQGSSDRYANPLDKRFFSRR